MEILDGEGLGGFGLFISGAITKMVEKLLGLSTDWQNSKSSYVM